MKEKKIEDLQFEEAERPTIVDNLFDKQFSLFSAPKGVILFSLGLALIFLILGLATFFLSFKVDNISITYADDHKCTETNLNSSKCSSKFTIESDIQPPIYMLYVVKNMYVNHRKYLNSYSLEQIKGQVISSDIAEEQCSPFIFNKDIPYKKSFEGISLVQDNIASPCGIKPQAFFNDTFKLYKDGQRLTIDRQLGTSITAVDSARGPSSTTTQWIDPSSEHFKLHMMDSSLTTKKKVWGVIRNTLKAGNYELHAHNNFLMSDLKLNKGVFFTTSTIIGGKQYFYSICFAVSCLLCILFAIFVKLRFKNYSELRSHRKRYL